MSSHKFKIIFKICIVVILLMQTCFALTRTVHSHLRNEDLQRLQSVFEEGIKQKNDLQTIYYSLINSEQITAADQREICSKLINLHSESKLNEYEKNFYLVASHKHLKCSNEIPKSIEKTDQKSISKDVTSVQEIYFNLLTSKALGIKIEKVTIEKYAKNLQNILKKDDSPNSLGYAFHVATELGAPASFVVDRVEDAIVQADEVDGKMLQFEGGLSVTALVINGVYKITKTFNKPSPLNEEQAMKFSTYFLSRRSVQTAKGAHLLIESFNTMVADKKNAPICIEVIGNGQLPSESPVLSIKVVDLIGAPVSPSISSVSGKILQKNTIVVEKVVFTQRSSDKTIYNADLSLHKLPRGIYSVEINADNYHQILSFKVLGKVKVNSLEIGVGDTDMGSSVSVQKVNYPSKLLEVFQADHTQKVILKLVLIDEITSKPISVHQSFVRLVNQKTDEEIIFVIEQDSSKVYKFELDVGARSSDFSFNSGLYKLELIVGDSSISNSFVWYIADVQLKFLPETGKKGVSEARSIRTPLPEIIHKFREPEKRPARIVSDIFTGLSLTPLVLLLIVWMKLGVNVKNLNFSLSTFGFHLGFGSILGLFVIFWLKLNMFDTIRYLIPIAIFTFICGNRLLRSIAGRKS